MEPHDMAADERSRPRICLNMIVRNEAHIIHELIASVAAHIDSWVIVDTGSTDGTQELIRRLMAERGIPGELFERPWRNFGSNRTEALELAQGRGDYIWVMDADDVVTGTIDFSGLTADGYSVRIRDGAVYWRVQLFRDGVPWRYTGVLHEVAVCDVPHTQKRLEGDYGIESRRLGARNQDPQKYVRDAAILQAEVDRNPNDMRSVFYLAQSYFDAGDFASARKWYARRAEMGGWQEEVYYSLYRVALAMERGGESWPAVQDAYLKAWSYRPCRAEPLYMIARHYRVAGDYRLGHLFAERAARIPLPADDVLFVPADVYEWRALDEQAVCGSWIGKFPEMFAICERLLTRDDIPAEDRTRIAANRDLAAKNIAEAAATRSDAAAPAAAADTALRQALARRLQVRTTASGQIRMPAVPALLDECQAICLRTFATLGVEFTPEQTARLREVLAGQLAAAYAASPRSEILVTYDAPVGRQINWTVKPEWASVQAAYDSWVATRKPPFFGTAPDARVWSLANEAADPRGCPVLDIGAGTGRNALALARRGHPVDAVEMSGKFAAILRDEAARESLPVRVIERDLFAGAGDLRSDYGLVVLSEVVTDFRDAGQLRRMFELAAACLAPGGRLVFNVFLPRVGYTPDDAARQLGQQVYTSIFTASEVTTAAAGLSLELVTDDSAHDYEQQHLPEGAWPPTGWYADWASGRDVFDLPRHESPIELRWLVYRLSCE
jgi:glycosyltransferase involved in cell wall biosynthesis/SAM-dependent methyltransferase